MEQNGSRARTLAGAGRGWISLRHGAHGAAGILEMGHRQVPGAPYRCCFRWRGLRQRPDEGAGRRPGDLKTSRWPIECDVRPPRCRVQRCLRRSDLSHDQENLRRTGLGQRHRRRALRRFHFRKLPSLRRESR